jgi:hypothetical protein
MSLMAGCYMFDWRLALGNRGQDVAAMGGRRRRHAAWAWFRQGSQEGDDQWAMLQ